MEIKDRLVIAKSLSEGKRVLDVGGLGMVYHPPRSGLLPVLLKCVHRFLQLLSRRKKVTAQDSAFANALRGPAAVASEHRIVDFQPDPKVNYLIDLNKRESPQQMREAIDAFKPEVILCMECLEHVNYRHEVMNEFARAIDEYGATVFVTIPNNANWIFNSLGWNFDHSAAYFKGIAHRCVSRSDLGQHDLTMYGCMSRYVWYWWVVYALSFFQPFGFGFVVRPKTAP